MAQLAREGLLIALQRVDGLHHPDPVSLKDGPQSTRVEIGCLRLGPPLFWQRDQAELAEEEGMKSVVAKVACTTL